MNALSEAGRPLLWNISESWIMYLLFLAALLTIFSGFYLHFGHFYIPCILLCCCCGCYITSQYHIILLIRLI